MNQFFSLARFGRLFRKHTAEHFRAYLMATGVLLGGLALVMGFASSNTNSPLETSEQAAFFILGLFTTEPFFTSTVFAAYGNKRQATADLMLPASHVEKFLVGWLYSLPIFLLVYTGCFYLVDSLVLQFDVYQGAGPGLVELFSNQENLYLAPVAYVVVNAAFLWGSIFFTKQHFIRTAFAVLLGMALLATVNFQVEKWLIAHGIVVAIPYSSVRFKDGTTAQVHMISLTEQQAMWYLLLPLSLLLLSWAGAYARLTEKEI